MAGLTAWLANPFWTASAEAVKWGANKIGGGAKSLVNQAYNMPGKAVDMTLGTNRFQPNYYKINESASDRDYAHGQAARGLQVKLADRLTQTMNGEGPSVAELQARQGVAQALQNAGHQAASARGMSRALAQRSAVYAGQQAQQQANRDAALMRAQEQLAARGQFANVTDAMRQGDAQDRAADIGIEQGNQQSWGQQEMLRTRLSEGNSDRNQKGVGALLNSAGGVLKGLSDIRAKEDIKPASSFVERLRADLSSREDPSANRTERQWKDMVASNDASLAAKYAGEESNRISEKDAGNMPTGGGVLGGIGGGMESFGAGLMSDERAKSQVQQSDPFAKVTPYSYTYKPSVAARMAQEAAAKTYQDARTPRVGVMAQDLEKSPAGDEVVSDTPVGKMLDLNRSVSLSLAGVADLDKRIRRLEGGKAAR